MVCHNTPMANQLCIENPINAHCMSYSCLDDFIYYNDHHHLMMEGVEVETVAAHYGTPLYCYSRASIVHAIGQYQAAFKPLSHDMAIAIHYAAKANSRIALLQIIKGCNIGLDIVSVGEMMAGLAAGFAPQDIIYSGVGKTAHDIAWAIEHGVGQLNIESFDEINMVVAVVEKIKPQQPIVVAVRVNPDISAGGHGKISTGKAGDKFGIAMNECAAAYKLLLASPYLAPRAIAMHIGSQLTDMAVIEKSYRQLAKLIGDLHHDHIAIEVADIGGGMAINYDKEIPLPLPDYAAMVGRVFSPLKAMGGGIGLKKIAIEPGRSIIARAGLLVCRVILQKTSGGRHITVVDAAMNDLIRPTLYHAHHSILPLRHNDKAGGQSIDTMAQDVVGGICETGDFFALARNLPRFKNDDKLAIFQVGAYGAVMMSNYNTRMMPAEILIEGTTHKLIKPRQTFDDFFALENKI